MNLREKVIRLAQEKPQLRGELLPLLSKGRRMQAASLDVDQALKMKPLRLSDLAPEDKKAGLRYYKKARAWRVQQAFKALNGKVPEKELRSFLENSANGYSVDMLERERNKWPRTEEDIYRRLVDPKSKENGLWPQIKTHLQYYGGGAQKLKDIANKLLKGKSLMQLFEAGVKSEVLGKYHYEKLIELVTNVDNMNEDTLARLVAALKKV